LQSENSHALFRHRSAKHCNPWHDSGNPTKIANAGALKQEKMRMVAHVTADHANPRFFDHILKRQMTFMVGQGKMHGDLYDFTCWGIV
jgi:hypothetical protein